MVRITLSRPADFASLGVRWQALQGAAAGSFFQSWSWVGCEAERRFADPVLLEAKDGDRTVALALLNRERRRFGPDRLWLGESGVAALDDVFVEHNGPLIAREWRDRLLGPCLRALGSVVLSGVDDAVLGVARGLPGAVLQRQASRPAPYVDLAAVRAAGFYLDGLSANARYQIRRSARRCAADGPLVLRRAETVAEAHGFLDALAVLHQARWTGRGRPGAFANPDFLRFHRTLIARALPEIDLLRVTAGERVVGYLYNFRFGGVVSAYQSGFDYAGADPHRKPGLTCHHLAIEAALRDGLERYDFLAGGDRYKISMAHTVTMLHWIELVPAWSPRAVLHRLRGWAVPPAKGPDAAAADDGS